MIGSVRALTRRGYNPIRALTRRGYNPIHALTRRGYVGMVAICYLLSSILYGSAQPTNPPVAATLSVTVTTNLALYGRHTNFFWTNLTLLRAAGIVAPTNAATEGYVPVARGNQTKWEAAASGGASVTVSNGLAAVTNSGLVTVYDAYVKQPASDNLTNWSALTTNAFVKSPTNSGSDGQLVSLTGNNTKWVAGGTVTATNAIGNLAGFGTNTTLFFNSINWGTNHTAGGNDWNVLLGGAGNTIYAGTTYGATILNGFHNYIHLNSPSNTIIGGISNTIYLAGQSAILSGNNNLIGTSSREYAVIAGGQKNTVDANYGFTVGYSNTVTGDYSVGLGNKAYALHNSTFIWSDNQPEGAITAKTNTFIVRAANGVGINTNNPGTNALKVVGNVDSTVGFSINGVPLTAGGGGGVAVSNTIGVTLISGIAYTNTTDYSMLVNVMAWYNYDNAGSDMSFVFDLDTNLDATIDFTRTYHPIAAAGNDVKDEMLEMIPPGASYTFTGSSNDVTFFASLIANSATLSYFLPSGGGGGGGSGVYVTAGSGIAAATNSGLVTISDAYGKQPASANLTNWSALATNAFVLSPTNTGSDGQVVSLTGNQTKWIAGGGGSVAIVTNAAGFLATLTGHTAETNIFSATVPANTISTNNSVDVEILGDFNGSGTKQIKLKCGGVEVINSGALSQTALSFHINGTLTFGNYSTPSAYAVFNLAAWANTSNANTNQVQLHWSSVPDFTLDADSPLDLYGQLSNSGDNIQIKFFRVTRYR